VILAVKPGSRITQPRVHIHYKEQSMKHEARWSLARVSPEATLWPPKAEGSA